MVRPPRMRSGPLYEAMLATFDGCAAAGAELLSIESVGGKEVHDEALMMGDLRGVIFGLCVLGVRDMRFLWTELDRIARKHGVHCAGDTACGFGNTAMVLAEQKMIPRVFAAVVRAVSAVRTLVCYECGAVGPGKDCGYENPILKAITGYPMAMEGKTAACAHLSPLGNIAAASCDTWSNESVQNIKLLVYSLSGVLAAFAGVLGAAKVSSSTPLAGTGYEFDVIAAVIIGGALMEGGKGTVLGAVLGAVFIGILRNSIILLGVSPYWQQASSGLVIIVVIMASALLARGRENKA